MRLSLLFRFLYIAVEVDLESALGYIGLIRVNKDDKVLTNDNINTIFEEKFLQLNIIV